MNTGQVVEFPTFSGVRCLMMPFIQGDSSSVPNEFKGYSAILDSVFMCKGDVGFLTIDESLVKSGVAQRATKASRFRALHTEAGKIPGKDIYRWGGGWGRSAKVVLEPNVRILLSNSISDTCAIWNVEHPDTSLDGDLGYALEHYPYADAIFVKAGEVHNIGIVTPHESLPVLEDCNRQFLRIVSSGVHGSEDYFTRNPMVEVPQ